MIWWYGVCALVSLYSIVGAYYKRCYLEPAYARSSFSISARKPYLMHKHRKKDEHKHAYKVPGNRGECYIHLSEADMKRLTYVLKKYDDFSPVTDAMIECLLYSKSAREEVAGYVLRDFKKVNESITINDIKEALNLGIRKK